MTCPILTTGPFRRELARLLSKAADTAKELHSRIVAADPDMAMKLPTTDYSPERFAFEALAELMNLGKEALLPHVVSGTHVSDRMNRLWQVRSFLVALKQVAGLDGHARTIADYLAQHLPFAATDLGADPIKALSGPLLEHCLRADINAKTTLIGLGTAIFRECERISQVAPALAAWLYSETGVTAYATAPTLRVLSIRLAPHAPLRRRVGHEPTSESPGRCSR